MCIDYFGLKTVILHQRQDPTQGPCEVCARVPTQSSHVGLKAVMRKGKRWNLSCIVSGSLLTGRNDFAFPTAASWSAWILSHAGLTTLGINFPGVRNGCWGRGELQRPPPQSVSTFCLRNATPNPDLYVLVVTLPSTVIQINPFISGVYMSLLFVFL